MIFISHRGFRVGVIENTIQAFKRSLELKMDFIELDVRLSKDGNVFILHDENLERIFQNRSKIGELSINELKSLRSQEFNQKIPELEEVFDLTTSNGTLSTKLMIELKGLRTAEPTCKLIKKRKIQDSVVFSSRNLSELKNANKLLSNVPLCLNITKCKDFTLEQFLDLSTKAELPLPFSMISLKSNLITDKKFSEKCHEFGIKALSWGFYDKPNPINLIKSLITRGIDGILFDDPNNVARIRNWIKKEY